MRHVQLMSNIVVCVCIIICDFVLQIPVFVCSGGGQ